MAEAGTPNLAGGLASLQALKAKSPNSAGMSDAQFALALHDNYYKDIPLADFLGKVGLSRGDVLYETRAPNDAYGDYARKALATPGAGESPEAAAQRQGGFIPDRRPGTLEGIARGYLQGGALGFGDEIVAGGAAALDPLVHGNSGKDFGQRFQTYLSREQGDLNQFRQDNPVAAYGSEIGGALATMGAGPSIASLPGRLALNGAEGALYGFGSSEGDPGQRAIGAGTGMALGMGMGAVGDALGGAVTGIGRSFINRGATRRAIAAAPTTATLKGAAQTSYDTVKQSGAVIARRGLQALRARTRQLAIDQGIALPNGQLSSAYPKLNNAIQQLSAYTSGDMSMAQAQVVNRAIRQAAKSSDPQEAALGLKFLDEFNTFMDALPMSSFRRGNGRLAISQWKQARQEWARFRRTQTIDDALSNARFDPKGYASGLRSQFGKIVKSPSKRMGFSADELRQMEQVAAGAPVDEFLKFLQRGGPLPAYFLGHMAAGPVAGAAIAGAKAAGNLGLRAFSNAKAKNVGRQIRASVATPGGIPLPPPAAPPTGLAGRIGAGLTLPLTDDPRNELVRMLSGGGGGY